MIPNVDNPEQPYTSISLCTGLGLLDEGLERAVGEVRTVAYVEIEAVAAYNLVKKMETGLLAPAPICTDVKAFARIAHHFCGKIFFLTGGYPCQPFSLAGKRLGSNDPRHLWPYIQRIIKAIRPICCFFENVDDHITLGYDYVQKSLWEMGYIAEAGIFSAEEVGATHERKRVFILAILADPGGKPIWNSTGGFHTAFTYSGKELDNSTSTRCENIRAFRKAKIQGDTRINFRGAQWPARPGQEQHDWEAPRIESSMGFTAHGHNFREDLLRLAGNAVVPQTAELAFRTLIQKFY